MDPKNINQLDPKLKEAYDRVMGVDLSSQPSSSSPPSAPLTPSPTATSSLPPLPPIEEQHPSLPNIPPPPPPLNPPEPEQSAQGFVNAPVATPPPVFQSYSAETGTAPTVDSPTSQPTGAAKPKSKMSPILLIIVGVVFFAIYAVLWGKIFKVF